MFALDFGRVLTAVLMLCVPVLAACQKQPPPVATQAPAMALTEVQDGLKRLGLYSGAIDGDMGPQTVNAIRAFQRSNGMAETGVRSYEMEQALRVAIADGSEGTTYGAQTRPQAQSSAAATGAPLSQARSLVRRNFWPATLSEVDLNDDGMMDVIAAAEYASGRCGAQACSHMVLINRGGGYEVAVENALAISLIASTRRTKGYRDLKGQAHGGVAFTAKWDGRTYRSLN